MKISDKINQHKLIERAIQILYTHDRIIQSPMYKHQYEKLEDLKPWENQVEETTEVLSGLNQLIHDWQTQDAEFSTALVNHNYQMYLLSK